MEIHVSGPSTPLTGSVTPPGDKSISHREVLFAAMAEGTSYLEGVLDSADVRSTMAAVTALGATVTVAAAGDGGLSLTVEGWGERGPRAPDAPIDCGNSGTTTRLLMGVLAGWPVDVTLVGDASLQTRPMSRVAEPLREMGATITLAEGGTLPARIEGGALRAIDFVSPVASAQVKSAVLLAGLRAHGTTSVTEPARSRDHTERVLPAFGVPVTVEAGLRRASVTGPATPSACSSETPGDASSAAFLAIAAAIVPGSDVRLENVSVNPTRIGFLGMLDRMGVHVDRAAHRMFGSEPVADLAVRGAPSMTATVTATEVPSMIDEIPVLAVAASQATGRTRFEGVAELRVKESDRLEAVRAGLASLGADVEAGPDWLEVRGPAHLIGTRIDSLGDHRLAMAWTVAGLVAEGETVITGAEAVGVSYPGFVEDLGALGASVSVG
jgi:3-phosphoshikimate 1-carboxyvinyltransferase